MKKDLGSRDISYTDGGAYATWPLTLSQRLYLLLTGKVYILVKAYPQSSLKRGELSFKLTMIPPEGG